VKAEYRSFFETEYGYRSLAIFHPDEAEYDSWNGQREKLKYNRLLVIHRETGETIKAVNIEDFRFGLYVAKKLDKERKKALRKVPDDYMI
jgi:hypothetical protein